MSFGSIARCRMLRGRARLLGFAVCLASVAFAIPGTSAAQSLVDALSAAYETNPDLLGARAELRSVNEEVPQALGGWRPSVEVTGSVGYDYSSLTEPPAPRVDEHLYPRKGEIEVTQPLFDAQIGPGVEGAEALVQAQRAALASVEQKVLLAAAKAYLEVAANQRTLELRREIESALENEIETVERRLRINEATRSDLDQALSRLAGAQSDTAQALAELNQSLKAFSLVTELEAGRLSVPPSLQGLPETLTMGLVSALNRPLSRVKYANFIQTDAAINPGNSGGPLLDVHGRVIGINTAIYSTSGGSQGVGFAIPINEARRIADQLMDTGEIRRGFIGIVMSNLTPEMAEHLGTRGLNGAVVTQILDESPAKGKLRVNDAIVGLNDVPLRDSLDLRNTVASMRPGDRIKLSIVRNGRQEEVSLRLSERPDEKARREAKQEDKKEPEKPVEEEVDLLGFSVRPIDEKAREEIGFEVDKGLLITNVKARSNAQMEGIEPGMVILQVNQEAVGSLDELEKALDKGRDRATVLLLIRTGRGDQLILLGKSKD